MIALNLLVLRAQQPDRLVGFYEKLGLRFKKERHGAGPEHHACTFGGSTLEIYPALPGGVGTSETRIGFVVDSIDRAVAAVAESDGRVISRPKQTPWGRRAVIEDREGHRIELTEAAA